MVVMSAECHVCMPEASISPLDAPYAVPRVASVHDLVVGIEIKRDRDALQCELRQILLLLSSRLEIRILHIRPAEKEIQKLIAGDNSWCDGRVQAVRRREVGLRSPAAPALRGVRRRATSSAASLTVEWWLNRRGDCCTRSHFLCGI